MALVEQRFGHRLGKTDSLLRFSVQGLNAEAMETVSIPTLSLFSVEPPVYTTYTDNNLPVSKELRRQPHTKASSQTGIKTI